VIVGIYRRNAGFCNEYVEGAGDLYGQCGLPTNCSMTVELTNTPYDIVLSYCQKHGGLARLELELVQNYGFDGDPEKFVMVQ
jgi:hypothetical protein